MLAVDEINAALSAGAEPSTPVLAVLCNDAEADIPAGMSHLTETLGAHSVIASMDDAALRLALAYPSTLGHTLFLSPNAAPADEVTTPLLWHLGGLQRDLAGDFAALLERDVAASRASGRVAPKILSVVGATKEDEALADQVDAVMRIDGYDAVTAKGFDRYRRLDLDDADRDARDMALGDATSYAPDIVLVFAGGRFGDPDPQPRGSFLVALDDALAARGSMQPRYTLGPHARDDQAILERASASPSFRARSLGLDARRATDPMILAEANERFSLTLPKAGSAGASGHLSESVYDALYVLFYAESYAAQPRAPETVGSRALAVAESLTRLAGEDAPTITVGPGASGLDIGLPTAAAGGPIDLLTTSGPAAFDSNSQARPGDSIVWCWSELGHPEDADRRDVLLANPTTSACP